MKEIIIFVDIDDTLNPIDCEVSQYTKKIMKEARKKGIKVVINTGRCLEYAINKSKEGYLSEYVISSNGSEVYNYLNDEIIYRKIIPSYIIKKIYDYCITHKIVVVLNSLKEKFISSQNEKYKYQNAEYFDDIDKIINNYQISQITLLSSNYDRMLVIPNIFYNLFPEVNIAQSSLSLIEKKLLKNEIYYHDLIAENTSKSTGIVELLDYLKINNDNAIAIGDGYCDIPMMEVVKTGVAVSNAVESLKQVAEYETNSAKEDGVAHFIENNILRNGEK